MKKIIPIIAYVLIATAVILTIYLVYLNFSGICSPSIPILLFPLVGVASALLLYHTIREPKETMGRKSSIVMYGVLTIAALVVTILWFAC